MVKLNQVQQMAYESLYEAIMLSFGQLDTMIILAMFLILSHGFLTDITRFSFHVLQIDFSNLAE